jgi:DNA-binding NtrC family response regulator
VSREPQTGKARILVADDDPQIVKLFTAKLMGAGYAVETARTGTETLSAVRLSRYDLLILDLNLPQQDGFDVLKTVRVEMPYLRVLVISGYLEGVLLEAAQWPGAVATLEKTAAPTQLVPAVRRILGDG